MASMMGGSSYNLVDMAATTVNVKEGLIETSVMMVNPKHEPIDVSTDDFLLNFAITTFTSATDQAHDDHMQALGHLFLEKAGAARLEAHPPLDFATHEECHSTSKLLLSGGANFPSGSADLSSGSAGLKGTGHDSPIDSAASMTSDSSPSSTTSPHSSPSPTSTDDAVFFALADGHEEEKKEHTLGEPEKGTLA
ncbi:uncharacterized protein PODANS_6_6845 [Podospora anserina S mat+]|uniref:Podospora anserina S mat+ genomic DNA chromosome 6, supercontig 2 n=1 Tax=Podospora anserina (strain S / ATCC MYA-4624 / DSM 980 / FGSC 10383) TaxID=515849 RepID=B2B3P3_PODAN|nr:uncharacterized protein PODANS_6_6845 [Podospora anserina S mat+]CAP71729.1 unnamed protein product [Podospora anserina S mat+]CDP31120.1 Putative protein of unknown function [Podospora anserina S mat+]